MKRRLLRFSTILIISTISFSCKQESKRKSIQTEPITFKKEGELYLIKSSGDTIQKLDIEIAESDYEQETGLMYRKSMKQDQGMLFIYDSEGQRSFYMKNTYIPLDIIYFDADSSLVNIQKNAEPMNERSLSSEGPAKFVLEIKAGLSDIWNLESKDKISFQRLD